MEKAMTLPPFERARFRINDRELIADPPFEVIGEWDDHYKAYVFRVGFGDEPFSLEGLATTLDQLEFIFTFKLFWTFDGKEGSKEARALRKRVREVKSDE